MSRVAKAEAEALRERLAIAEARAAQLSRQNAVMRERLGDDAGVPSRLVHRWPGACCLVHHGVIVIRACLAHPRSIHAGFSAACMQV